MMMRVLMIWIVSYCWLWNTVTSFSIVTTSTPSTANAATTTALQARSSNSNSNNSRRAFLNTASAVMGSIAAASVVFIGASPLPVFAAGELNDLAMPTAVEPLSKDAEAAAMAAKLKRKAELQKKAAAPRSFTESFQGEMEKQKDFKKQTQAERRDSMCETLGRGC